MEHSTEHHPAFPDALHALPPGQASQQAAAAKVVTRVGDGMLLNEAVNRTMNESDDFNYLYGLISLDSEGHVEVGKTAALSAVFYAFHDGEKIRTFFE